MPFSFIIPGAISLIGGALSSSGSRSAARDQNAANAAAAAEQNRYNMEMFRLGRGEGGSAVLPTYLNPGGNIGWQEVFAQFPQLQADYARQKALHGDKLPPPDQWLELAFARQPEGTAPIRQWIAQQQALSPETRLANDIIAGYDAGRRLFGTPEQQAQRTQGVIDRFQPSIDITSEIVSQVLDGTVDQQRTDAQGAVEGARATGLADTAAARATSEPALAAYLAEQQRRLGGLGEARTGAANDYTAALETRARGELDAVNLAEREALNRLATQRAMDGYSGTSTGYANAIARSLLGARQAAAGAIGDARIAGTQARGNAAIANATDFATVNPEQVGVLAAQNALASATERAAAGEQGALERRSLVDTNLQSRLGALDLPFALAERQVGLTRLPREALYQDALAAQQPLGFFRLGEARPPTAVDRPAPVVAPGAASVFGNALTNVGGAFLEDAIKGGGAWDRIFGGRN